MGYIGKEALCVAREPGAEPAHQTAMDARPAITHLGSTVCITTSSNYQNESVVVPLRNGFPLHACDRRSPIFSLMSEDGCRAGHAVMINKSGLLVHFDDLAPSGRYFVRNSSPVGHA